MSEGGGWGRRLFSLTLIAAATAFIVGTVVTNSRELATFDWQVRPQVLALSILAHVLVLVWGVFVWSKVIPLVGYRGTRFPALLRIWSLSNAAKYIPGVIWQFLAAARLGATAGLPKVVVVSSMLVHVMMSLLAACVIAVLTLPLTALGLPPALNWPLRVAIPLAGILAVHPRAINFGILRLTRLLRRDVLAWEGRWGDGLTLLGLSVVSWVFTGIAYFLFLSSLTELHLATFPVSTGVNALAFAAGLVVPVPGGLGIRESAMTLLLDSLQLPASVAAIVSVGARLWSVVTELALVLIAMVVFGTPSSPPSTGGSPLENDP